VNGIELKFQDNLFGLLRYYGSGNRPKFAELVGKSLEYAGVQVDQKDQSWVNFIVFNVLKYVGIIDTSETSMTRWSYSLNSGCFLDGDVPYFLGQSKELLQKNASFTCVPFFSENSGYKFGLYKFKLHEDVKSSLTKNPSFSSIFETRCPEWHQVESLCLSEEQWTPFLTGNEVNFFNFGSSKWENIIDSAINERALVRISMEYSGTEYRIVFPKKNISFRIIYPEWAFVAAGKILNVPFPAEYHSDQNILSLNWRARLPTIFTRYLCCDNPDMASRYSKLNMFNIPSRKVEFLLDKYDIKIKDNT
jgi:hypothetical protein